jgi:hypothetical protein
MQAQLEQMKAGKGENRPSIYLFALSRMTPSLAGSMEEYLI